MNNKNLNRIYFISISIAIFLLDQLSKYFISNNFQFFSKIDLILFRIQIVRNYGAAFNIFSGNRFLLSLVSISFSFILLFLLLKKSIKYIEFFSYSFILGGALGNGIDRIIKGYVVDFIDLKFINFPVFNIADISINIGFILILYNIVRKQKET